MRYIDTSAFLKLVAAETESADLRTAVAGRDDLWSSLLLAVEAHRAARRLGVDRQALSEALEAVTLVTPTETTFAAAQRVGPDVLRTLDALHLAAALELGPDLEGVITYDRRMATGCQELHMQVDAPGRVDGWWRE